MNNNPQFYTYDGQLFPEYLKQGNAMQYSLPFAQKFCIGYGLDVGCSKWPLPGAIPVELEEGGDAMNLPPGPFDYIHSSHCLEHLANPVSALLHWKSRLRTMGTLFLYLPHPDMRYWNPTRNRKHLHTWAPKDMAWMLEDLGFINVIHSERDLAWGFIVVGFNPGEDHA